MADENREAEDIQAMLDEQAREDGVATQEPETEVEKEEETPEAKTEPEEDDSSFTFDDDEEEEEPEADEPEVVEKPAATADPQPAINIEEEVRKALEKATDGKIKSLSDLKQITSGTKPEGESEQQDTTSLGKQLDDYLKRGGKAQDFLTYRTVDVTGLTDIEKVKLSRKWDKPHLSDDEITKLLTREYHLYDTEDDKYDEEDADFGKIKLKDEARQAEKAILEKQEALKEPEGAANRQREADSEAAEQAEQVRQTAWKEKLPKVLSKLSEVAIQLNDKVNFKYPVKMTAEMQQDLAKIVTGNPNINADEEGEKTLLNIAESHYLLTNIGKIMKSYGEKARSMSDDRWGKLIHNPSVLKEHARRDMGKGDPEKEIFEKIMQIEEGDTRR